MTIFEKLQSLSIQHTVSSTSFGFAASMPVGAKTLATPKTLSWFDVQQWLFATTFEHFPVHRETLTDWRREWGV